MPPPIVRNFSLQQLISKLSVRGRIAAIAVIPVVGFLANGLAFTGGETAVGNAFESVRSAAVLADASREFRLKLIEERKAMMAFGGLKDAKPSKRDRREIDRFRRR